MKTVGFKLSKELKDAGYPQDRITRQWRKVDRFTKLNNEEAKSYIEHGFILNIHGYNFPLDPCYDSPAADEILDLLPSKLNIIPNITHYLFIVNVGTGGDWDIRYRTVESFGDQDNTDEQMQKFGPKMKFLTKGQIAWESDKSLANTAAKMWLYLKKNNYLNIESSGAARFITQTGKRRY